jgi:hypothetical protein
LFLREPFDLAMDASKLKTLTPIAQSAIMHRQGILAGILPCLPWVAAVLAVLGLILVIWGLLLWYKRQRIRDRGEEAATKKAEHELQQMTIKEVEAKARQELEGVEEDSQQPQPVGLAAFVNGVNAYLDAERALYARMNECLGPDVHIETHKRAGDVEYDAIVRLGSHERVIVEVKYIRKGFNYGWLTESVNGLTAKTALYGSRFSTSSRPVLVIILASPNRVFVEKIETFKERLRADRPRLRDLKIHCVAKEEIPTLTCQQVRKMFEA